MPPPQKIAFGSGGRAPPCLDRPGTGRMMRRCLRIRMGRRTGPSSRWPAGGPVGWPRPVRADAGRCVRRGGAGVAGIGGGAEAERRILIRRLSFDLTGLPLGAWKHLGQFPRGSPAACVRAAGGPAARAARSTAQRGGGTGSTWPAGRKVKATRTMCLRSFGLAVSRLCRQELQRLTRPYARSSSSRSKLRRRRAAPPQRREPDRACLL